MKKRSLLVLLLALSLLLAGCQKEDGLLPDTTRPTDPEPTAVYDWMAGESPVPVKRIGVERAGLDHAELAVSPTGVYYLYTIAYIYGETPPSPVILYADNGSDMFIELCGRPDCTHDTVDCNAYVEGASNLTYYGGYLYVISNGYDSSGYNPNTGTGIEDTCKLLRMDPDGSNRVELLDLGEFAKENGAKYAQCDMITEGYCLFHTGNYVATSTGGVTGEAQEHYYYKLDGSMEEPEVYENNGWILYNCGDVTLTYFATSENGGEFGSYWDWDPETDKLTFLTDHPGTPGYYGEEEAYYFKDGGICRLTYATQTEEVLVDTGLTGKYYLLCLPDCMVVVNNEVSGISDKNLYIYNWAFELVDTVEISYPDNGFLLSNAILGETAERIILTDTRMYPIPTHYINKSELGTGNVEVHEFDLSAVEDMRQSYQKYYTDD